MFCASDGQRQLRDFHKDWMSVAFSFWNGEQSFISDIFATVLVLVSSIWFAIQILEALVQRHSGICLATV